MISLRGAKQGSASLRALRIVLGPQGSLSSLEFPTPGPTLRNLIDVVSPEFIGFHRVWTPGSARSEQYSAIVRIDSPLSWRSSKSACSIPRAARHAFPCLNNRECADQSRTTPQFIFLYAYRPRLFSGIAIRVYDTGTLFFSQ